MHVALVGLLGAGCADRTPSGDSSSEAGPLLWPVQDLAVKRWLPDLDGDGVGGMGPALYRVGQPAGHVLLAGDCDDTNPARSPGAEEVCNYVDDDCDFIVDEGVSEVLFTDSDGDGFGDDSTALRGCSGQAGTSELGGDCDDETAGVFPGAPDTCGDGVDADCDGVDPRCVVAGALGPADAHMRLFGDSEGDSLGRECDCLAGVEGSDPALFVSEGRQFATEAAPGGRWYVDDFRDLDDEVDSIGIGVWGSDDGDFRTGVGGGFTGDLDGDGISDVMLGSSLLAIPTADSVAADDAFAVPYHSVASLGLGRTGARVGDSSLLVAGVGSVYDSGYGWGQGVGHAYLLSGPLSGAVDVESVASAAIGPENSHEWAYFGWDACSSDLNGDGVEDVLVSAPAYYGVHEFLGNGAVYALYGPVTGEVVVSDRDGSLLDADARVRARGVFGGLGTSLSCLGDVDGDGTQDATLGAPSGDGGVAVFSALAPGDDLDFVDASVLLTGSETGAQFGYSVSAGSDMDGDGAADVWSAASVGNGGDGAAYLFYGPLSGTYSDSDADAVFRPDHSGAELSSVSACGDLDGDGFGDVGFGAPGYSAFVERGGALFVLFGGGW